MGPVPITNERPCYQGLLYYNDTHWKCPKLVQYRSLVGLIQRRNEKYIQFMIDLAQKLLNEGVISKFCFELNFKRRKK
jgi:hypothetical protein